MSAIDFNTNSSNLSSSYGDVANTAQQPATEKPSITMSKSTKYEILKSLNDIRSVRDLSTDAVRDILRHQTRDGGLEIVKMNSLVDMSGCNDAFNSSIVSLTVQAKYTKHSEESNASEEVDEEFFFVIKSPPNSRFIRMMHKFTRPFYNEVSWYLDLISQMELANGKDCMKNSLPLCYHAYSQYYVSEEPTPGWCELRCPWFCFVPCRHSDLGVLILENITKRSGKTYRMFDKHKPLDEPHVRTVMKALAHFHGRWLKYKFMSQAGQLKQATDAGREPMSWANFEFRYNTQKRMPKMVYNQLKNVAKKTILRVLEKQPDLEGGDPAEYQGLSVQCRRFLDQKAPRVLHEYLTRDPTPIFTLCHGDFWSNNIMFSYEETSLIEADDPILIDFQLINYGHPCYDLVYFMYLNTDLAFRDEHLQSMLTLYYETLSTYFQSEANYLPDKFSYTFDDFMIDYRWHTSIGFVTALAVMPNVLSDEQVNIEGNACTAFHELQRKQIDAVVDDTLPHSKEIRRRLIDLVKEMARENVI